MPAEPDFPRLELEINGRAWQQVTSLETAGPRDRCFTLEIHGERAVLRFGDGVHGARPPSRARQVSLPYQPGAGYTYVALQMGRAQPHQEDEPVEGSAPRQLCGLYRAVVLENLDPCGQMRLKIQSPEALGLNAVWALPCLPPGVHAVPQAGQHVWIQFEHGDPDYPVWMGVMVD
jgi:hypothetical protein